MANILILEPFPEVAELIGRLVTRSGHSVLAESEAKLNPDAVDVVVLEPELLRGVQLAKLLREVRPDLPVVIQSLQPLTDEARELRPAAYLMKPWSLSQLSQAIELALEGVPLAV
jgi:two-component SAPR family response regulator